MVFFPNVLLSNPYPDPRVPPRHELKSSDKKTTHRAIAKAKREGKTILRIDLAWDKTADRFSLVQVGKENSGTAALERYSQASDPHGSFKASLYSHDGMILGQSSVGTGKEFRYLSRGLSFRFPLPTLTEVRLTLDAEDPLNGKMVKVIDTIVDLRSLPVIEAGLNPETLDVKLLRSARTQPPLLVNIYAEGYLASEKAKFWRDAEKVVQAFESTSFPGADSFELRAVFYPSNTKLGSARDLGPDIATRDSFLSLYFPYWHKFGRWYHIVYPTNFQTYRSAIGAVAYDYPIALINDRAYWGVGNFKELTAVPADNASFVYLLLHEFGHFLGLNEEYEGGGPTELAFAPGIDEPWSQNITFHPNRDDLKWAAEVDADTPLPTPSSEWNDGGRRPIGAYLGGYADTAPLNSSHKSGFSCRMNTGSNFCAVCSKAIKERVRIDLGVNNP